VAAVTGVALEVAPHAYTTRRPAPAMMPFEDVLVQLVDLPPVSSAHVEAWLPNLVRNADAALVIADLSAREVADLTEDCLRALEERKVRLVGGEPATDPWASVAEKRALLVGTKLDLPGGAQSWEALRERYGKRLPGLAVSGATGENLGRLREAIFRMLHLVRVYSKPPGREADRSRPFVLVEGSTILDFARTVHRDFAEHLKFARVWGRGKFDGQRATKDYRVADGDVVELHTR
jgi:hypothetical protein